MNATGEIFWTFTTTTATGTADLKVTVTQSKKTIFTDSFTFAVTPNGTYYAYVFDAKLSCAHTGTALVTVTTTVGAVAITGKTTLQIQ